MSSSPPPPPSVPNVSSEIDVEKTISLEDIQRGNRELKELEADARAVLGNSDAENCTWERGYVKRQALYACITCRQDAKDPSTRAGVCLACSYSCHDGHELVELYTKRAFRCDCGNHKFNEGGGGGAAGDQKSSTCKLLPGKNRENSDNIYNHNSEGNYCTCGRPYPDSEDDVEDDMIQCVACEDWYHSRHLRISESFNGGKVPEDYHEMICHLCSAAHPFLASYANGGDLASVTAVSSAPSTADANVGDLASVAADSSAPSTADGGDLASVTAVSSAPSSTADVNVESVGSSSTAQTIADDSCAESSRKRKLIGEGQKTESDACRYKRIKKIKPNEDDSSSSSSALFFGEGWRSTLCSCSECKRLYEEKKIEFLTREDDSVGAYEAAGAAASGQEDEEEAALGNFLGSMDRFQQGELLTGYNDMKTSLNEFLRKFAEEGKVVTAEDIRTFFQEMEVKKAAKSAPQYFCG